MPTEQEKQWIAAWRRAGPELERIRNAELRQLDETAGMGLLGAGTKSDPHANGLVAFQRWGEPRVTRDLEATVLTEFGQERPVIDSLLRRYQPRISDPVQFALQARVVLLQNIAGHGIDLSLGGMPYEERVVDRSSLWGTPAAGSIQTCSAEDLVVLKAFASRPQDWIDVEKVIIRQGEKLDHSQILEELPPLVELKEEPEILTHLTSLLRKGLS